MPTFPLIRQLFTPHTATETAGIQTYTHTPDDWLVLFNQLVTPIKLVPLYGTCLGFYRDNQIIPHDTDADFGVLLEDLPALYEKVPALLQAGFFISGRGNYQLTFSMPNTKFSIDIWPYKRLRFPMTVLGHKWLCDHVYYKSDFFGILSPFTYNKQPYYLPTPCEAYLEFVFGPEWRIPLKGRFAGPRGLLSQYINSLFIDFPVPAAFSGCNDLGTYKPWVSRVLKTLCPDAKLTQLYRHPESKS